MAKVRIHSWAKENKKSSIEVVKILNAKGHNIRNQTMPVEESVLNSLFKDDKPSKPQSKPAQSQDNRRSNDNRSTNGSRDNQSNNNNGNRDNNGRYNNNNGNRDNNGRYNNNNGNRDNNGRYNNNNGNRDNNGRYNNNNGNRDNNGYRGNNENGERRYNNNNGNRDNNGYRGNNNNGGYRGNNENGERRYNNNGNGGQGGYRSNNNGGQGGYRGNNENGERRYNNNGNGGQGGYRSNNNNGGYRSNNENGERRYNNGNGGQGGYRSNNNGGQGGYRGNNENGERRYNNNGNGGQGGYRGNNNGGQGGYRGNNNGGQGGYRGNNNGGQGGYRGNNNNGGQGGYRGNNNNGGQGGYRGNNNGGQGGYRGNNNGGQGGYRGNNNNGGQGGYRGNNNGGQGGYRSNNNGGQGGYRGNNNGGQGGYRGNNNGGQGGYRGGNQGGANKPGENTAVEQKPTNNKRRTFNRKPQQFDKFKQFDRENSRALDGKTKTQLKKEARVERQEALKAETNIIKWKDDMTVASFAQALEIPATDIVMKLFELGIMATMNQAIDKETAEIICTEFNAEIVEDDSNSDLDFETLLPEFSEEDTESRPPIVTIMGHVDHGKTTLLDTLRNANVTAKEAGGITQHIGAYQIDKDGFKVTFLDTPGHAAFTAMRARGANVTDITILVVAADDGVMPQTKEAVAHAKEAKSPLIVAVNKMDKPDANPDRVMSELAELGVLSEEWGGETPFVKISALKGEGLDDLIEYIKVITDIHEFKAPYNVAGFGTVIEANLDRGRGPVATVLMQGGHLSISDSIVIGDTWGSIRVMQDEYGKRHKKIGPSMPVEITGLKEVPQAGDQFVVMEDSKQAQLIGEKRASLKAAKDRNSSHALSLEELNAKIAEGEVAELPVIIKADVQGSVEALAASLEKIDVNGVKVRIVHRGVGGINESDVLLATSSNAIMIGFNVRPDANTRKIIEKEQIELMIDNVIYNIIEKIEDAMNGLRATKTVETIVGYAKIEEVFKITGVGKVAGSIVTEGKIIRSGKLRLLRDSVVIYDGEIGQLKRYKDDAKEVIEGQDFGISFKNFEDLKKGDELECYEEATEIV